MPSAIQLVSFTSEGTIPITGSYTHTHLHAHTCMWAHTYMHTHTHQEYRLLHQEDSPYHSRDGLGWVCSGRLI